MTKKECILKATLALIEEKGLNNLTVSEIAFKADVGKGTIYEYFSTKEEVIADTIKYFINEKGLSFFKEEDYQDLLFEESLKKYIKKIITFFKNDEFITQLFSSDDANLKLNDKLKKSLQPSIKLARNSFQKAINYFIEKGIKEGVVNKKTSKFVRKNIKTIMMPIIIEHFHNPFESEKKLINNLIELLKKILI